MLKLEREKNELNEIVTNLTNRIKGLQQDQTIKMKVGHYFLLNI